LRADEQAVPPRAAVRRPPRLPRDVEDRARLDCTIGTAPMAAKTERLCGLGLD